MAVLCADDDQIGCLLRMKVDQQIRRRIPEGLLKIWIFIYPGMVQYWVKVHKI